MAVQKFIYSTYNDFEKFEIPKKLYFDLSLFYCVPEFIFNEHFEIKDDKVIVDNYAFKYCSDLISYIFDKKEGNRQKFSDRFLEDFYIYINFYEFAKFDLIDSIQVDKYYNHFSERQLSYLLLNDKFKFDLAFVKKHLDDFANFEDEEERNRIFWGIYSFYSISVEEVMKYVYTLKNPICIIFRFNERKLPVEFVRKYVSIDRAKYYLTTGDITIEAFEYYFNGNGYKKITHEDIVKELDEELAKRNY